MKKNIGKLCATLLTVPLIFAMLCGLTTVFAAESIVLAPGQTEFTITVTIPGVTTPIAGADMDVVIDDGSVLAIKSASFPNGLVSVSERRLDVSGSQVSYEVGFGSAKNAGQDQNEFSGNIIACTITFSYTGTQPSVVTIRNFQLKRLTGMVDGIPRYNSETPTLEYVYNVSVSGIAVAPKASPAPGTYNTAQTVTLSSDTQGASIHYTTNGTDPTSASTQYTGPIMVSQTTTIKAIAIRAGLANSSISTFTYTINPSGDKPDDGNPGDGGPGGGGPGGGGPDSSNNPAEEISITDPEIPLALIDPEMPFAPSFPFTDVKKGDWFYDNVYYTWENKLIYGVSSTLFSPNTSITRGMIVTILYRMEGEPGTEPSSIFSDVPNGQYYTGAVIWAENNGIAFGYPDGTFRPNDPVTRQDLAALLARYAGITEMNIPQTRTYEGFDDDANIAGYAKEAVITFYRAEIISGKPNNMFDPNGTATRSECAAMIHRMLTQSE